VLSFAQVGFSLFSLHFAKDEREFAKGSNFSPLAFTQRRRSQTIRSR